MVQLSLLITLSDGGANGTMGFTLIVQVNGGLLPIHYCYLSCGTYLSLIARKSNQCLK